MSITHTSQTTDAGADSVYSDAEAGYSTANHPPIRKRSSRSWWPAALDDVRSHPGEWRRLTRTFTKSTARQLASDLRCAHEREPEKMRVGGTLPGDRWETSWAEDDTVFVEWVNFWDGDEVIEVPNDRFVVWLRFVGRR